MSMKILKILKERVPVPLCGGINILKERAVCASVCVWNVLSVCVMRLVCRPGVSMKILKNVCRPVVSTRV